MRPSFDRVHRRLHALARYLQPFFLEEPPNLYARGWAKVREGSRAWRRFRKISGDELADLVRFTTGSLGEFVERHFETDRMRRMYLANNVYGMHAPPYMPGTAIGLLFHLLSGGAEGVQGFYGHVMGGMGSVTQAMAAAVRRREARSGCRRRWRAWRCGRAARPGWCWSPATSSRRRWCCPTPTPNGRSWG